MNLDQLAKNIVEYTRCYSQYRDLFQQFVKNEVYFTLDGDNAQVRNSAGEILTIRSDLGYVRQHLAVATLEDWEKYGLVHRVVDAEGLVYRLTETGYRLGH
jgi:hypothetical protein